MYILDNSCEYSEVWYSVEGIKSCYLCLSSKSVELWINRKLVKK